MKLRTGCSHRLKFHYADFALTSCLQRYLQLLLLMRYYDIHCQYIKHLRERLEKEFDVVLSELDTIVSAELPELVAGVGKYPLAMDKGDCRHKRSLHYLPGVGMADGEMLERIWAATNTVARRTKEMTLGHRNDVLNHHYSALNVRRVHAISTSAVGACNEPVLMPCRQGPLEKAQGREQVPRRLRRLPQDDRGRYRETQVEEMAGGAQDVVQEGSRHTPAS